MVFKHTIFSICLLFLAHFSCAINFMQLNIAYQYDPLAEIELKNRVVQSEDELSVFLGFRADTVFAWSMEFLVQHGYEDENHSILQGAELDTLRVQRKHLYLKLTFKKPKENLLVVKIAKRGTNYYFDVNLEYGSYNPPSVYAVDSEGLPIFENYINTSSFLWKGSEEFSVMEYAENFDKADGPMAEMKVLAPSFKAQRSFTFRDSVQLKDGHFYVVRSDKDASSGVTMVKTFSYYPKFKLLNELSRSMQYIMNEQEQKEIRASNDLKKTFDSFWLKTYKTKFRARNAIRNYFNWVEQSNYLFTDFKQGWKTDRGMLFIVYGVPDEVYRSDNSEEWYYDSGPAFEFIIISTFFAPRTYALRRRRDIEDSWLEHIAAIRRGLNE